MPSENSNKSDDKQRAKTVSEADNGRRLDAALQHLFPGTSRSVARQAILRGDVTLNGKQAKIFARTVKTGDVLAFAKAQSPQADKPQARAPELKILHRGAGYVVIDKPAHLLSE